MTYRAAQKAFAGVPAAACCSYRLLIPGATRQDALRNAVCLGGCLPGGGIPHDTRPVTRPRRSRHRDVFRRRRCAARRRLRLLCFLERNRGQDPDVARQKGLPGWLSIGEPRAKTEFFPRQRQELVLYNPAKETPMGRCIPVTGCLASRRDITNAMT